MSSSTRYGFGERLARGYQDLRFNLDVWGSSVAAGAGRLATGAWNYGKDKGPTEGERMATVRLLAIMSSRSLKDTSVHFNDNVDTDYAQSQAAEEPARLQRKGVVASEIKTGVDDDSGLDYETKTYTKFAHDGKPTDRYTVTIWNNGKVPEGTTVGWEHLEADGETVSEAIAQVGSSGTIFGDGGYVGERYVEPFLVVDTFGKLVS